MHTAVQCIGIYILWVVVVVFSFFLSGYCSCCFFIFTVFFLIIFFRFVCGLLTERHSTLRASSSMSEQQQPRQRTAVPVTAASKAEVTVEENFAAMRHAAMSMFKQRTKDLTMVSALTAEAEVVEKLNCQVQSTINSLQEQKAILEARIEAEERRVKEREEQLRGVHTMLAQMKEDQGVFSGVRRSSEKIAMTLHQFVTQYTAKGGNVMQLLERCHERTHGRAPNEWRTATNDLRRRQSVLEEHIKHIETHQTLPSGFADILLEWSRGVWRQQHECATALRVCEELLSHDALGAIRGILPTPTLVCGCERLDEDCDSYADACMREIDTLVGVGKTIEDEGEHVGLCCAVVPSERVELARSRWLSVHRLRLSLREVVAASCDLSKELEEQLTLVKLLSDRVVVLDAQIDDDQSNLQQDSITIQREKEMHENLFSSWQKALQTAIVHMQCEATCRFAVESKEADMARQEVELEAKTAEMESQWTTLHTQTMQLYTTLLVEEQQKAETLCHLTSATDEHRTQETRLVSFHEACEKFEGAVRQECDEMDRCALAIVNHASQWMVAGATEEGNGKDENNEAVEEEDSTRASAIKELLQQLLQFEREEEKKEEEEAQRENVALSSLMASTGLDAELLRRAAHSVAGFQREVDREVGIHLQWRQETEKELLALAVE
ncbi:hypothetical protein MOQ_000366 [Trypanosoma cruzi marinkellei]|uniref:Uncharacterized protein n=1 Tax=Trypanosoma cruzi marinkellei TaxID=85056 RepID=K2PEL1_TRYCR|nr:hypothetical protein MOQ_000366 [Trypanosoma cruzi marinkellei]